MTSTQMQTLVNNLPPEPGLFFLDFLFYCFFLWRFSFFSVLWIFLFSILYFQWPYTGVPLKLLATLIYLWASIFFPSSRTDVTSNGGISLYSLVFWSECFNSWQDAETVLTVRVLKLKHVKGGFGGPYVVDSASNRERQCC